MGFNANVTLIKPFKDLDDEVFLRQLGYKYTQKRNSNLDRQIYTQTNFSIGEFEGVKIIAHNLLPIQGVGDKKFSVFEKSLSQIFKDATILSIGLQGAMNVYGYSLIENGRKTRANCGSIEGKLFEYGKVTPRETEVYTLYPYDSSKKLYFDEDNSRYINESWFGEELVMSLSTLFFSEPLDQMDLSQIKMRCYTIEPLKKNLFQKIIARFRLYVNVIFKV